MQRRPKPPTEDKPPSATFIALVSLFGYPGAGHFVIGSPRWGAFYAVAFTLTTLAGLSQVWYLVPELWKMYQGYATTISRMPNFGRLGLWIVLTAGLWIASACHSAALASRQTGEPAQACLPSEATEVVTSDDDISTSSQT